MADLLQTCKEKIVIAAHRGVSGGNIPCNTMAAYRIACNQGADMLEVDLNMTADGKLVIFHPKEERDHLGFCGSIRNLTYDQITSVLRYVNYDRVPTEWTLCTFDEVLEEFGNKCFINVDKFWDYPAEIAKAIKAHGMQDRIVVKTAPNRQVFDVLEEVAPELMFLPIYRREAGEYHEELKRRNINYVGAELLFPTEDCEVIRPEFIEMLHKEGKIAWANAILYNFRVQLSAGHSDDVSLLGDPDAGWGWLADAGFDIIQTDWVLPMRMYLEQTGKRFRK
ncbi:MAG: glycerophosphodiester phosphodiesterase family protein [Clostridia bacterium]|nr:glycerophosphodiester phosphodiesterase family protein [Clostridia bacterium]